MGDPNWANVTLLTATGGSNGSTTFTDLSANAYTITETNMTYSSTETLFGQNTATGGGTGAQLALGNQTGFQFGLSDFTIEGFYYPTSGSIDALFATDSTTSSGWMTIQANNSAGTGRFQCAAGNPLFNFSSTFTINQWSHFALVRASGVFTFYIGGTSVGSGSASNNNTSPNFCMPSSEAVLTNGTFSSYMGQIRVTNGVARYTSNFTPPSAAFPVGGAGGLFVPAPLNGLGSGGSLLTSRLS